MPEQRIPRTTPWVWRLILINAVVLLLMQTVLRSEAFLELVWFDPAALSRRPWTLLTYLFVHANLAHLFTNSLALFVFGTLVERRLGSTPFLIYYLFCGLGGALLSLALSWLIPVGPTVGASGAVLGVAFAFARFAPDARLMIFPLPVPIRARTLVMFFIAYDVLGAWLASDNIAHLAHLGGILFGWIYLDYLATRGQDSPPLSSIRTRTTATAPAPRVSPEEYVSSLFAKNPATPPPPPPGPDPESPRQVAARRRAEIDRVLDKISASGMDSLTPAERELLESERRNNQ